MADEANSTDTIMATTTTTEATTTIETTTTTETTTEDITEETTNKPTEVLQEMKVVKRKRKSSKPDLMDTTTATGEREMKRPSFPPAVDTTSGTEGGREFRKQ